MTNYNKAITFTWFIVFILCLITKEWYAAFLNLVVMFYTISDSVAENQITELEEDIEYLEQRLDAAAFQVDSQQEVIRNLQDKK